MALRVKSWDLFKSHFRGAQKDLKEIRGPTMQQAGYHHANMLASQLRVDLNNQQTEMLAMVQNLVIQDETPAQESRVEEQHAQQAANATIESNVQMQMLQILQAMQAAQAASHPWMVHVTHR